MRRSFVIVLLLNLTVCALSPLAATGATNEELERRLNLITEELQKLKNESAVSEPEYKSTYGLGPAASKVYGANRGLSIGGYGEGIYTHYVSDQGSKKDTADMLRAILYFGYKFTDKIVFNSEIELEHADEVFVEMAQLDFLLNERINLRTGLLLLPVGLTNELHEPTLFHGVHRPFVEREVIPSTWREMGVGVFGKLARGLSYKFYVVNGLDAEGFGSTGLRGGRQKGSKALAEDLAITGSLAWSPMLGLSLGASTYLGNSGQGKFEDADVFTSIYEIHGQYKCRGLELKALAATVEIDDHQELSSALATDIPESITAWYAEAAYDVLPLIVPGTTHYLAPFVRYEDLDYDGSDESKTLVVAGLSYKPIPNVVLKTSYRNFDMEEAGKTKADELNFSFGYIF